MDYSVVREVLEDIVTIVCGDSSLFGPLAIRPSRRCRWRSASPVNIPPKKLNGNKYLEPKREPKLIETDDVSCSSSSSISKKSRSDNTSSEMLLSDSAVSASKLQPRCRDHDESQSSLSDGNRKLHKRKRSRSRSRSRSPSSSDDVYVCNVCSDEFRRPQVLCHHLYRNHQLPSCCAYCNKHFYDTTLLMKHIKAAHAGRTSFDCWFCTLKPSGMRQFWDHMWRYHKKNMFRCRCGQICFSAHCFRAHQALCSKLKIKSFHDVRWDVTLSKPSNKHAHENKRRQKFYNEGYQEKKQKFLENGCEKVMQNNEVFLTNAMQCSAAWPSPPIYQNDNTNVSPPIYPTDGNVMPPINFYPMQTVFGFNANLKDPRIQKKLNANGDCSSATATVISTKSLDELKGVDDKESSPPDIPMASSTPVNDFKKMGGPIEISNVISQAKNKSINDVAAPPSTSLAQPTPHWLNLAPIGGGFGEYNSSGSDRKTTILSPISPPEFECFPNATVKLLTDFSKQTQSSSSSSKVLSCGCKTGSINHEVCDILKDLKQEMDMAETPSRSASTVLSPRFQIDSVTVTGTEPNPSSIGTNISGSIAGGIAQENLHNIPASVAISNEDINVAAASSKTAPKLIPKKSDEPPATIKSNLKMSTKNVVQVRSKNKNVKPTGIRKEKSSGVIELTSPIKNKEKANKISNAAAAANQRAVKILPFAKVEQIHQKLAEKMMNKEISSQSDKIQIKTEPIDDATSKKDNAKQKCNRKPIAKSAISVDQHEQVQSSSSIKKVLDLKTAGPVTPLYQQTIVATTTAVKSPESCIPPKKRWASEFVESAKCLEKQKALSITSSATVSTSPTTTSDRIETEFQCDLCDYRCSKKKSMEKHLIKKHCLSVVAERYVNFYKTYEICKTVVVDGDEARHLINRENMALSVKYDHLRKEVALLKQCFSLMKPEMNR